MRTKIERYLPTDVLIKDFIVSGDEVYKKGTLAYVVKPFRRCMNVAFVTKTGIVRTHSKMGCLLLFGSDHFRPKNKWFKKID